MVAQATQEQEYDKWKEKKKMTVSIYTMHKNKSIKSIISTTST